MVSASFSLPTDPIFHRIPKQEQMSRNVCYSLMAPPLVIQANTHTGNQMKERLQAWLSPPDPSMNHNYACKTRYDGTTMWFIQGSTFREWKKNGSLLWICGNRMLLPPVLCLQLFILS
jgi:hypothetical protein